MKKILFLAAMGLFACGEQRVKSTINTAVITVDSCQYVVVQSIHTSGAVAMVHKANCTNHHGQTERK